MKKNLKQWATIFKGFGNPYRLQILKLLKRHGKMSVTKVSEELGISFKNTSRNLSILANLDLVESEGRTDRVYYSINSELDRDLKSILNILLQ